jgi:hypothetical protein
VHAIVEHDFSRAPDWLSEGLATQVEVPDLSVPGEIRSGRNKRHDVLLEALRSPETAPSIDLDRRFSMTTERFYTEERGIHFSLAHDFCRWMDSIGKLWPFYRFWRENAEKDHLGRWSFQKVMGKSVTDANGDWLAWVRSAK